MCFLATAIYSKYKLSSRVMNLAYRVMTSVSSIAIQRCIVVEVAE